MFAIISKQRLLKLEAQEARNTHDIAQLKIAVNKIHKRNNKKVIKDPKLTPHWFKVGGTV